MKRYSSFQPNTLPGINKLNKIFLSKKWEKCIISISFSRENPSNAGNQVSGCCVHAFLLVSATPVTDTVVSLSAASLFFFFWPYVCTPGISDHPSTDFLYKKKKMHLAFYRSVKWNGDHSDLAHTLVPKFAIPPVAHLSWNPHFLLRQ